MGFLEVFGMWELGLLCAVGTVYNAAVWKLCAVVPCHARITRPWSAKEVFDSQVDAAKHTPQSRAVLTLGMIYEHMHGDGYLGLGICAPKRISRLIQGLRAGGVVRRSR